MSMVTTAEKKIIKRFSFSLLLKYSHLYLRKCYIFYSQMVIFYTVKFLHK